MTPRLRPRASRLLRFVLRIFVLVALTDPGWSPRLLAARAATPEWELPAARRDEIEKRLTPLATVLNQPELPSSPSDSGAILLSERVIVVDEQGRRTSLYHSVYKTLTDAAVSENSEEIIHFRKHDQRAYLLAAETIQPDGSHQPVKPDAVFLQSPQRQAQYSLYDDQAELKVIFPNVKPGSVTRLVCVIEDQVVKIPGEFHQSFTWGSSWAAGLIRSQIDLPVSLAARLRIAEVGAGLPTPVIEKLPRQRVRYTWTRAKQPGRYFDRHTAPTRQVGPALNFTTLKSWDDIARWYHRLLADRSALGATLTQVAAGWTADATTPAEILARLHAHVADDVRYVGLEFGAADYQPHRCADVWENQYGDCKDKANLLVSLLRDRGLKAFIALVNTEHLGLVDRRSPDFRPFNHAIVAVPQPAGGYLFCDPTISYSQPGLLSPGSADRDVLVIADDRAEWVRTPAATAGSQHYQLDLKLTAAGELSGWLSVTSDGYYGAAERASFARLDADAARSQMSKVVRGFFPGAEVVDVTRTTGTAPAPYVVKAFFLLNGQAAATGGRHTLTFPTSTALFNDLGDRAERDTTFFAYRDHITAEAVIALPAGLHPTNVPPPFHSVTPGSGNDASWTFADGTCRTRLTLELTESAVRPDAFKPLYQSQQSLKAWLAQSIVLTADATAATTDPTTTIDLPLMPTADGQIDLVDKRYPDTGSPEARRLALERALQYFPNDKNLVFRAGVRLAMLDWDANRLAPAHDRLQILLTTYAGQLKPETYAWGDVTDALVLRDLKRTPEAISRLRRIAHDTGLSNIRRIVAATNLSDLLADSAPAEALSLLQEVAALPEGATANVESRLAVLLLTTGQTEPLRAHLAQILSSRPDSTDEIFTALLQAAAQWRQTDADRHQRTLADLIDGLRPAAGASLRAAIEFCRGEAALRRAHTALTQALTTAPLVSWFPAADARKDRSAADYDRAIKDADARSEATTSFRAALEAVATLGLDSGFPERLWRAASYAEWVERQSRAAIEDRVCDTLLDLCEQLPPSDQYFFEGKFIRAKRFGRDSHPVDQQRILRAIIDHPSTRPSLQAPAIAKLGSSLEATGDFDAALVAYRRAEPLAASYGAAVDCLLHAVFINLSRGHDDEALRLLTILEKAPEATRKEATAPAQLAELLALQRSGQAPTFWQATRRWWPAWKRFATTIGVLDSEQEVVVPEIPDLTALGQSLGAARRSGNLRNFFSVFATLASAARWQPSLASEASSVGALVAAVAPSHVPEFRRLMIAVLSTRHPPGLPNFRNRQLGLAAYFFDDQRPSETLRVLREFNSVSQPPDQITQTVHRLHGYAALATGEDLAAATATLEADYADAAMEFQRTAGALILADLYRRLGRLADEEQFLARELASPRLSADERKSLADRRAKFAADEDFAAKLDAWLKIAALPWYDLADPKDLDDPRLRDLEAALRPDNSPLHPVEHIKAFLLAARGSRLPLDRRRECFRDALRGLANLLPDYRRADALAASVVDDAGFDDETRLQMLWNMLAVYGREDAKAHYAQWRKHPLTGHYNDTFKRKLGELDELVAVDRDDPAAVLNLTRTFTGREVTAFGLLIIDDAFGYLLDLGHLDAAAALADSIPNWKFASDVAAKPENLQLDFARRLRLVRRYQPVHAAMLAAAHSHFPDLPDRLPAAYQHLRRSFELPLLDRPTTRLARLHLLRQQRFDRRDLDFWRDLFEVIVDLPDREDIALDLLHAGLAATTDDELHADLFSIGVGFCDTDSPTLRSRLEAEFAPFRRPVESPRCYAKIRLYEVSRDLRAGLPVDPETAFADASDPQAVQRRQLNGLRAYTRRGDRAATERLLASLDSATLLSSNWLTSAIPAFRLLGMDTELRLATTAAERELRSAVLNTWVSHRHYLAGYALRLAEILQQPSLLPGAWIDEIANGPGDPIVQHEARLIQHLLSEDWSGVESEAVLLNRDFPTHYRYFWHRGLALHHLGRDRDAVAPLTTYTTFAKDELEYTDAVALLKKISAPSR